MSVPRKLGPPEPACGELSPAIGHVLSAKNSKREHLFRRQIRFESRPKLAPHRLGPPVDIALLHLVVNLDPHWSHQSSTAGP